RVARFYLRQITAPGRRARAASLCAPSQRSTKPPNSPIDWETFSISDRTEANQTRSSSSERRQSLMSSMEYLKPEDSQAVGDVIGNRALAGWEIASVVSSIFIAEWLAS